MEKKDVLLTLTQDIDGDEQKHYFDAEAMYITDEEDILSLNYVDETKSFTQITIYFQDDNEIMVKTFANGYNSLLNLRQGEKRTSQYFVKGSTMELQFLTKKIIKKSLDIYVEYDIFTNGNLISKNKLEIEVK